MKLWITRWALTRGIFEVEGEICKHNANCVTFAFEGREQGASGLEWHRNPEDACHRVSEMLVKKIKNLTRQISRLEAMDDDPNWPKIVKVE